MQQKKIYSRKPYIAGTTTKTFCILFKRLREYVRQKRKQGEINYRRKAGGKEEAMEGEAGV